MAATTTQQSSLEADLAEIRTLLKATYEHYFEHSDGYCKSSEGAIEVSYSPYFWSHPETEQGPSIEIYSSAFGSGRRSHRFANSAQALEEVREWHREELTIVYCPTCKMDSVGCWCTLEQTNSAAQQNQA